MSQFDAERLLNHLESLTKQRERPLLEAALALALRDLLGATRVSILKLSQTPRNPSSGPPSWWTPKARRYTTTGFRYPPTWSRSSACLG